MKLRKVTRVFVSSVMIATALTGCSTNSKSKETGIQTPNTNTQQETTQNTSLEKDVEEVTITMLMDTDATQAGFLAVAELAKEKLGITVEIETRPGGTDGDNIVKTRLASGDMADICMYNSGALLSILNPSEYFYDLSNESWIDRLDDTYRDTVSQGSEIYGVPYSSSQAGAVLYSKPIYEELGLSVPNTWDEFIKNCETIKAEGKIPIIGSFADSWTAQVLYLGDHYNVL